MRRGLHLAVRVGGLIEGSARVDDRSDVTRLDERPDVFAHRIGIARASLSQRTTETSERILQEILTAVEVPL